MGLTGDRTIGWRGPPNPEQARYTRKRQDLNRGTRSRKATGGDASCLGLGDPVNGSGRASRTIPP